MKKSKKQRKNDFKKRLRKDVVIKEPKESREPEKIKDTKIDKDMSTQEDPSIIAQRILLRRVRGHNGKTDDEELER